MLTITDPAGARLTHLLKAKPDDAVVRIIRQKRRLRMRLDRLRPDDKTFAHNGRVILALDERMSTSLSLHKLDVRDTDTGPRLSLKAH